MVWTLTNILDFLFDYFLLLLRCCMERQESLVGGVTFEAFALLSELHTLVHGLAVILGNHVPAKGWHALDGGIHSIWTYWKPFSEGLLLIDFPVLFPYRKDTQKIPLFLF